MVRLAIHALSEAAVTLLLTTVAALATTVATATAATVAACCCISTWVCARSSVRHTTLAAESTSATTAGTLGRLIDTDGAAIEPEK